MELILPREKKTLETKKKIVDAVGRLIERYDFRYITVKNVCEEAGVAYGSFYHHFGTKEHVIYEYCRGLFEKMLAANPMPAYLDEFDFIRNIIWSFLVYAKFCELMGKDIIRYIYQNCQDDLFYEDHFDQLVRDQIQKSFDGGYLNLNDHPERLPNVGDDVSVVYKGVVMCWFNDLDVKSHRGRLCIGMEHVVQQILGGFRTDKYHELRPAESYSLFTDAEDFDNLFAVIPELQS